MKKKERSYVKKMWSPHLCLIVNMIAAKNVKIYNKQTKSSKKKLLHTLSDYSKKQPNHLNPFAIFCGNA